MTRALSVEPVAEPCLNDLRRSGGTRASARRRRDDDDDRVSSRSRPRVDDPAHGVRLSNRWTHGGEDEPWRGSRVPALAMAPTTAVTVLLDHAGEQRMNTGAPSPGGGFLTDNLFETGRSTVCLWRHLLSDLDLAYS